MAKCPQCGTEKSPGKFEGEPCYAEHFWNLAMEGSGEDFYKRDTQYTAIKIDKEDVEKFPCCLEERDIGDFVVLYENDSGFVYTDVMERKQLDNFMDLA